MFKVGTVTHYYDKLGVVLIELDAGLNVGETIKFVNGGKDVFEQKVEVMQIGPDKVDFADTGSVVGLKTKEEVKEGAEVYKL